MAAINIAKTDGPFASIPRALAALRAAGGGGGGTILIREGTYRPDKALELGPADSGTQENPLTIAGYPGEHVVIDGGAPISGEWTKVSAGPLWSIKPAGLAHPVEDLFYRGRRQTCARLPDRGWLLQEAVGLSQTEFRYKPGDLKAWPDAANAKLIIKTHEWSDETLPIQSIDESTRTVTTAKAAQFPLTPVGRWETGQYCLENLREGLHQPGQWCFNAGTGELLFWPPDGIDPMDQVEMGGLPLLVTMTGNAKGKAWLEHVELRNLNFVRTGRALEPRLFGGAAVRLAQGVRFCSIDHCSFQDLGGCGVTVWKEARNISIANNEFARTGDTAIEIFDYLGEGPPMSSGHVVENNVIHDCGTVVLHAAGIALVNIGASRVAHNFVHDMPDVGITVYGIEVEGWNPPMRRGWRHPSRRRSSGPTRHRRGSWSSRIMWRA